MNKKEKKTKMKTFEEILEESRLEGWKPFGWEAKYGSIHKEYGIGKWYIRFKDGMESDRFDERQLLAKESGLIQRLVDNDKIDFEKIKEKTGLNIEFELYNTMEYFFEKDALSIMLLSIQDNPIEYLCSILKE